MQFVVAVFYCSKLMVWTVWIEDHRHITQLDEADRARVLGRRNNDMNWMSGENTAATRVCFIGRRELILIDLVLTGLRKNDVVMHMSLSSKRTTQVS